jgi:hypothetical protein
VTEGTRKASDQDLNIPIALHRFMADRAGAKDVREIAGGSHAISVSHPEAVTASILEAANGGAAVADFTRANFVLANSVRVGVPSSWRQPLSSRATW